MVPTQFTECLFFSQESEIPVLSYITFPYVYRSVSNIFVSLVYCSSLKQNSTVFITMALYILRSSKSPILSPRIIMIILDTLVLHMNFRIDISSVKVYVMILISTVFGLID